MSDRSIFIDLNTPVRVGDLPGLSRRILTWWVGELVLMSPRWLQHFLPKAPDVTTLYANEAQWRFVPAQAGAELLEIDCRSDDKGIADQILHAAPNFSLAQVVIVLPANVVLRRRLELPMMPESQLASAVELQVDRLTPFKSDAVRLAVKVVARDPVEGKISVDVAITPRAAVDALEQRLSRLGFKAVAVDFQDAAGQPAGFDLSVARQVSSSRRLTMVRAGLAAVAVLTWYVAGVMWDTAREQEVESWQAHIAGLRPLAMRSSALRQKIDALTQPFAVAQAHRPGRVLLALKELTEILPDSARLTELTLSGDTMDLAGLASDAPGLIASLEASKLFKNVRFRSPVTRRPETTKDLFEISLTLEGAARP